MKWTGKRADFVVMTMSSIKLLYRKPEVNRRCCPVPVPATALALVKALALIRRTGCVVGWGNGLPAVGVAGCGRGVTGEAACAIASALFQFNAVYEGVMVTRLPNCSFDENEPPRALESAPT